jgi:hypothetical protein
MKDSMLLTILAGVSVFVVGQFILKLVLEPIVEFKKILGEISSLFLRKQASITNANASKETQAELKKLSSMILAIKQTIPFYRIISKLLGLPKDSKLILGCQSLNLISYYVIHDDPKMTPRYNNHSIEINKEMRSLEETLNIRVTYKEL